MTAGGPAVSSSSSTASNEISVELSAHSRDVAASRSFGTPYQHFDGVTRISAIRAASILDMLQPAGPHISGVAAAAVRRWAFDAILSQYQCRALLRMGKQHRQLHREVRARGSNQS